MLMTNENVRVYPHDRLLERTLLRLIPRSVTPNHITIFRVCLTPFVLYFLWHEWWTAAILMFLFAALTDALDGSLARVRKQITMWGTVADPAADKILIGSVVLLFVAREINVLFAVAILAVELVVAGRAIVRYRHGIMQSANWYGKMKMLFEVIGVTLLFLARGFGIPLFVPFSESTLAIAVVCAVLSLLSVEK